MSELERLQKAHDAAYQAFFDARDAVSASKKALDAEKERLALEGVGAPFPIGTKMYRKARRDWREEKSAAYGIVEAVTKNSVFPSNRSYLPSPGTFIVRILKKDGTLGKQYETLSYSGKFHGWEPV